MGYVHEGDSAYGPIVAIFVTFSIPCVAYALAHRQSTHDHSLSGTQSDWFASLSTKRFLLDYRALHALAALVLLFTALAVYPIYAQFSTVATGIGGLTAYVCFQLGFSVWVFVLVGKRALMVVTAVAAVTAFFSLLQLALFAQNCGTSTGLAATALVLWLYITAEMAVLWRLNRSAAGGFMSVPMADADQTSINEEI